MKKSVTNLFILKSDFAFMENKDELGSFIVGHCWNEKKPAERFLMGKTPRVRLLGKRIGDEKSNQFADMKAEFSWHEFPLTVFYYDSETSKIGIDCREFFVNPEDAEWIMARSTPVWENTSFIGGY